jgi:diguanylate cyclase (GGDEF)-like protein
MPKLRLTFVTRLVLLVLAVGIPLSAVLGWTIYSQYRSEVVTVKQQTVVITDTITALTESTLNQTRTILARISKRPEVQTMDRSHCDPFLVDLHNTLPQYANFNTLNKQWQIVCSAALNFDLDAVISSEYPEVFERMMAADDIVLSQPIKGMLTQKWVAFAAYPVKDISNKVLGAVTAPIDLTALAHVIRDHSLPQDSIIRIIDSNGVIVSSHPDTSLIGKYDNDRAVVGNKSQSGSSIALGFDGVERIYAYTSINGTDWVAFVGLPTAWAFADFRLVRNQLLLALTLLLALAAILAFIIAQQIVRPIRVLQRDAELLAKGKHDHRTLVVSDDEIGQLGATFNKLSQALETEENERRRADINIRQLNRVYAMLSQINALIVRVKGADELFAGACQIAADAGDFRMAMIVTVDRSTQQMVSIQSAGKDQALLTDIKELLSSPEGMKKSIVSLAVKEKIPVISNNTNNDPRLVFGKQYAAAGVNSMVVLPLLISGDVFGILALYAREIDFFHPDEMKLLLGLTSDIAFAVDHIEKQERLNFLAYYDELTGLANRNLFLERLAKYVSKAKSEGHQLAITLVDLERFKSINDSFGRSGGDALLKQAAEWWKNKVEHYSLLARIDADRFAIILPLVKSDGNFIKLIEKNMSDFLGHSFELDSNMFRISFKAGVALSPDDGADADSLFKNAETALKIAKKSGDRYLFYNSRMTATVADKLSLENRLRDAFDNEEFVLHYQPKVHIASGQVIGAEALIRWNDPESGLVQPGIFIPILEEIGLINDVGRWAVKKAIEDYLAWRTAGLDGVRIAVNVSPLQLRNRNFCQEIEQAIAIDPRAAAGLELEITESLVMGDVDQSIKTLHSIRAMGVPISIDDFGTGFSSLSYLSRLPLDTLKVDRSFVIEMHTQEGQELVSTIIRVAHALKLKVVAEGIETNEQLRQISALNCDQMQGYLFSKPVPLEAFENLFLSPSKSKKIASIV